MKKYLDQLIKNKTSFIIAIVVLALIAWCVIPARNTNQNDGFTDEYNNNYQTTDQEALDEAYEFVVNEIELSAAENIKIVVVKGENSIRIQYIYDEETTEIIKQSGASQEELMSVAENDMAPLNIKIDNYIKEYTGHDVIVDMELYNSDGYLYILIRDGQLLELNPVSPTNNPERVIEEPQPEQSQDPMEESNGRHMESTAPYGRCPSCNAANASDKSYQGNYCDDCYAYIKQKEYEEKHQYGDCVDCGVYLSKNEANSYGGRCAECYSRYYGNDNPNMGRCERCGDSVDMDHTNDGWGYNHLCSACTGELQSEESAQDASPYAG